MPPALNSWDTCLDRRLVHGTQTCLSSTRRLFAATVESLDSLAPPDWEIEIGRRSDDGGIIRVTSTGDVSGELTVIVRRDLTPREVVALPEPEVDTIRRMAESPQPRAYRRHRIRLRRPNRQRQCRSEATRDCLPHRGSTARPVSPDCAAVEHSRPAGLGSAAHARRSATPLQ